MKLYWTGKCLSILFPKSKFFIMIGFCDKPFNLYVGGNQSNGFTFQVIIFWMIFEIVVLEK